MSNDQDRVAVPTNGRRPHTLTIEPEDTRSATPESRAISASGTRDVPAATESMNAVSPRNVAIGLGILASLAVLVAGVLRRRTDR